MIEQVITLKCKLEKFIISRWDSTFNLGISVSNIPNKLFDKKLLYVVYLIITSARTSVIFFKYFIE